MKNKPTLILDFDGVIHSYTSGWQGIDVIPDPPVIDHNGVSAIAKLYEYIEHFHVAIFSTRSETEAGIDAMREWLGKWDRLYWEEHPLLPHPQTALVFCVSFPRTKPPALVTIDDRAITFDGTFPDPEIILKFKPWDKL